ncbi:MAG: ethanolamine ammonia-lyase reactivating factor EutA [Promethearchaeota archaeon]
MDPLEVIANFEINVETSKQAAISYVKVFLQKLLPDQAEPLTEKFTRQYEAALRLHAREDQTDLARLYRIVSEFKPALAGVLPPGPDFDRLCDAAAQAFNITLSRVRRQINERRPSGGPAAAGPRRSRQAGPPQLQYYCTVCQQAFEIPADVQAQLVNSDEKLPLPDHCGQEMVVKIGGPGGAGSADSSADAEPQVNIDIYPAELLMGHTNSAESAAEYLDLTSVGIDVGSSTTHLVFSRLTLKREQSFFNMTNRFLLVNREIVYEGDIIFTPLRDPTTIDVEAVVAFCEAEYRKAGLTPEQVDTGAVIVTGETAKKENAALIVDRLSSESGKFVSASAGPNFESLLAAMGSGIVEQSRDLQKVILNVDIGGGTSNLAVAVRGGVKTTACINVGGRLLGIEEDFRIWRLDEPTARVMRELDLQYQVGDVIPEADVRRIVRAYAEALLEVMQRPAASRIAQMLIMTDDLDFSIPVDAVSFSGGVGEMIYEILAGENSAGERPARRNPYRDIGWYLAEDVVRLARAAGLPILEPANKIRATVIGAGAFSLSVSGSTCYYDPAIPLPLVNVPVVTVDTDFREVLTGGEVKARQFVDAVRQALTNFNLVEGEDTFALYFTDINIRANLGVFSKALVKALPRSVADGRLILIVLGFDGAKMLGLTLRKETAVRGNLFCLDELVLEAGDWIDIGAPLGESEAFPITIKSLVFNRQDAPGEDTPAEPVGESRQPEPVQEGDAPGAEAPAEGPPPGSGTAPGEPWRDRVAREFAAFQEEHPGYEALLVLSPEGQLELSTAPEFCTPEEAHGIFTAWRDREPAFVVGGARFPILTWDDTRFATKSPKTKQILVGTRTHSGRRVLLRVNPGTKWQPNTAALAAEQLHRWAWELL